MAGISIAGKSYEEYKQDANDVIHIKLVRKQEDVFDDSTTFKPDMTHQVFGESESIFGYRDLKVEIFCTAARMVTYINVKYTDKLSLEKDGVGPDNIAEKLNDILDPGYFTNLDGFLGQLPKEIHFKPFGEKIHEYTVTKKSQTRQFEIYKTTIENLGFRSYHKKLQPFLLLYVDGASYIDDDDARWVFYLIFEKYTSDGETMYAFVGYATVYNYFAYPERIRPRISQVLIMPPYQKQGHGAQLIQTFYNHCYARPEVVDITVEDPSENFQRVRDFVDTKNCSKLKSFQPEKLAEGFCYDMQLEAREKLKINRKQARRIYEILRLKNTNSFDQDGYLAYKLDVKKRLNMPFMKNGRDFQKLQRALNPNELKATMTNLSREQRLEYLEKAFNELKEDYDKVIERVMLSRS